MAKVVMYFVVFIFIQLLFQASYAAYNVVNFGAKPDGTTDSSRAFVQAWSSACKSIRPATVYVPEGFFLVKSVIFTGPCKNKILFLMEGTIIAPSNYWSFGKSGFWILFYKVSRVTIYGGTLNAQGPSFWACRKAGKVCPPGARSISFVGSRHIMVQKLTTINSQLFHIAIDDSQSIKLQDLKIIAPSWSLNTDGIHIESSTGITISHSVIRTGDDCISLGQGSKNIWIERISCGPGHGISIGSLAEYPQEEGVQNVTVINTVFTDTQNGVRIKTWARPITGFVRDVSFRNIIVRNVYNPIIIDQKYCPSGQGCPNQNSGVKISGVTYKNIKGTSAGEVAMNFVCSWSNPCTGIRLKDIMLTYNNTATATSSCINAQGRSTGVVIPPSCF